MFDEKRFYLFLRFRGSYYDLINVLVSHSLSTFPPTYFVSWWLLFFFVTGKLFLFNPLT